VVGPLAGRLRDVFPKETGGVGAKAKLLPLLRKIRFGEREAFQTE
jgi:hypothetical protein